MTFEASGSPRITPQFVIGLGIVAFGLLLTAGNLGWLDSGEVWRYWPLVLIAGGLTKLANASTNSGRIVGAAIIAVGLLVLGDNLRLIRFNPWDWWPLFFVFMGLRVIFRSRFSFERGTDGAMPSSDQVVSGFAFWSAFRRRIVSTFKRADLTAIMGGVELDLRGATSDGSEAVIDVFAMWGGIEIRVGPDWRVSNQVTAIMGGVDDKSVATADAKNRLVVRGFVMMGGVEIKS